MLAFAAASAAIIAPRPTLRPPTQIAAPATQPIHVKIDGKWYDVTQWADQHPGGRYVLEWADGFDISGAFHTIHLFGNAKTSNVLARMPEADLSARASPAPILQRIGSVPGHGEPTGMDSFMQKGEAIIKLASPPAAELPAAVPVVPADGLPWQLPDAPNVVGQSALKADLEAMLKRHFNSPEEYKATPEHWLRIAGALALVVYCLVGWAHGSLPETLVLPFAQWLLFSPTVHEASHSTLSTRPMV